MVLSIKCLNVSGKNEPICFGPVGLAVLDGTLREPAHRRVRVRTLLGHLHALHDPADLFLRQWVRVMYQDAPM